MELVILPMITNFPPFKIKGTRLYKDTWKIKENKGKRKKRVLRAMDLRDKVIKSHQ